MTPSPVVTQNEPRTNEDVPILPVTYRRQETVLAPRQLLHVEVVGVRPDSPDVSVVVI